MENENQLFFDMVARICRQVYKEEFNNRDKTIKGVIDAINGDGTVNVKINGEISENVRVRNGLTLQVGNIVLVKLIQGNFSKKRVDDIY